MCEGKTAWVTGPASAVGPGLALALEVDRPTAPDSRLVRPYHWV